MPRPAAADQLRPDVADAHVSVEAQIGHRFRNDLSMAEVVDEAKRSPAGNAHGELGHGEPPWTA
jgi:hypothetical protein